MPYKVTVDGKSWLTEDLTLDEAIEVEKETGESWLYLNPIRSAKHAKAIIARFLARDTDIDQARARVGSMSVTDVLGCVDNADDDRPAEHKDGVPTVDPKAESGEPETT